MDHKQATVTELLNRLQSANGDVVKELAPLMYDELRRLASKQLINEGGGSPVNTTSLVHEAYLKLAGLNHIDWQNRGHFLSIAGIVMRRIIVDLARTRLTQKRGGDATIVSFNEDIHLGISRPEELINLDRALTELEEVNERQCRVVEYRFFGGLSFEEIASALDVSIATVRRDWRFAKAWLKTTLSSSVR
jgi:RNA polymerase sigma factor (TIGR02999 family)